MISVAIIEDLDSYRNAMQVLLNGSEGFECVGSYENAEIAIHEFPKAKPQVALVDINLPGMNGIELIDVLTEKDKIKNIDYVVVNISDSGSGIDPEILPRLFNKFVSKSFEGTGLGLFISKSNF